MQPDSFTADNARSIRRSFIAKFTDKLHNAYRTAMGYGDFYGSGSQHICLWESFDGCTVITPKAALDIISAIPEVFVTWERSPSKLRRGLQKSKLLRLDGVLLSEKIKTQYFYNGISQDFYVFTPDLSLHITFTHLYVQGFGNICLTSLPEPHDPYMTPGFRRLFAQGISSICS